ncbi:MAG: signal peptidase II [Gemmatimonadota bacterium]
MLAAEAASRQVAPETGDEADEPRRLGPQLLTLALVSGTLFAVDWVTKTLIQRELAFRESLSVVGEVVRFTYIVNEGAAFGLYLGSASKTIFLVLSALAAVLVLGVYLYGDDEGWLKRFALALILGGALGNIHDRLAYGSVVDFIDIGIGAWRWPIFNVADIAVTVGAILLGLAYLSRE